MSTPLVSFCFSTFNRGEILRQTLESVRRQTFTDYEVIVSDNDPGCSGRIHVEAMNDSRFKYFPNGTNLGMKASFNKSLERSSGEFIVMIADDDPVYFDMLETLIGLKQKYPGYSMYMGGCDWFCVDHSVAKLYNLKVGTNSCISSSHDLNTIWTYTPESFLHDFYTFRIFSHFLWSTCMVKRDLLIRMGGTPDYGSPFLGDYAYMSVASSENGCVIINKPLGCQTIHKENFGRNQNDQLPVVARNFPAFLDKKIGHIKGWDSIKPLMLRFSALWVVEHMSFLYHYREKGVIDQESLLKAEKEVFKIDYIRKYRFKFFLKKNFPAIHKLAVKIKAAGKKSKSE